MPSRPIGRMYLRKNAPGDGQNPRIRLWTLPIPREGSTAEKLLKHYQRVFTNIDALDAKKKELSSNAELTEVGRQRQALDYAFGTVMPDVLKARRALAKASQEVATKRSKLQQPASDKTDLAGALRRQELRQAMRAMDDKSRDAFLKQNGRLSGLDPEILQSIIEMPASMSGLRDSVRDEFLKQATENLNAPALEEIHYLERAIEIAASAIDEGRAEIQREGISVDAGYADQDRFEARAKEAAALAEPAWLKTFVENGAEILRVFDWNEQTQTGGWKLPSSEQVEFGIIADSKDQYDRLKVAAPFSALSGTGDQARESRADFINSNGLDAYFSRNKTAA